MALLCSRKVNLLSGKMGSQILSTVGQCQLYSHPLCLRWWFQSGATIRQYTTSTYYVERLLGEWNTILLTPVNRWLYDCLFLLVEEGKIWPPLLPDFYDPESTFVTECCRSPKLYCPCTSSMKLKRYYYTTSFHCSWESLSSNWLVNLEKHFRDCWGVLHTLIDFNYFLPHLHIKYKYLCK